MRLGCFGNLQDIEAVARADFDFIELNLREMIELDEQSFQKARRHLADARLCTDACSWVLPSELDLTHPKTKFRDWMDYVATGADRAAQLGTKIWPLGSGWGRSYKPQNGSRAKQEARVAAFVADLGEIAGKAGICVAVEPLGPAYSNYLTTIAEAAAFVEYLDLPYVATMCDLRHMVASGDSLDEMNRFGSHLVHAHIDFPCGEQRLLPRPDDNWDYTGYIDRITQVGIQRLSVEALHEKDLSAGAASTSYLRRLLSGVQDGAFAREGSPCESV